MHSEAAGTRAEPSGTLRIDMPIAFGRKVVLPVLAALVERHPGLSIDARLSDAYADLVKDRLDLAIRAGELDDSTLVARRFASKQLILVAAPAYLRRAGTPRTLDALSAHRHIVFRLPTRGIDRPQQFSVKGRNVALQPPPVLRFNDGEAMVEAAALGLGLTQVPDYMVADAIASGRLVEVLKPLRPPAMPIHAVMWQPDGARAGAGRARCARRARRNGQAGGPQAWCKRQRSQPAQARACAPRSRPRLEGQATRTANTSTGAALPLNGTAPSGSTRDRVAQARRGSRRRSGCARRATLVCASRRAARLTVSPMQV